MLANYPSYVDFDFLDQLYDMGAATIVLSDLDGNPAPAQGNIVKIVWDRGLATEQVHWQGFLTQVETKQQGNVYTLRAFTLEALLHLSQTGTPRNYLAKSPHTIIQAAGSPNPILINSQGATVLQYGVAAAVPNKVDGVNPGTGLTQFVTDSTTLLSNMKRLCMQARYDGASYGLEWTSTLEGANASDPRFYLVKRRERAAAYTQEVFVLPDDFFNARRGPNSFPGVDAVKVIGGGDGNTRIESALAGAGARELVAEDKAILNVTNADNMANRLLGVYGNSIEIVTANCLRHDSPSRSGDTVVVRQTGRADAPLRVMARYYELSTKMWMFAVGRPAPIGRDSFQAVLGTQRTNTTTPQFTDTKPESFEDGVQYIVVTSGAPITIAAHSAATVFLDSNTMGIGGGSFTNLGKSEGFWLRLDLIVDAVVDRIAVPTAHSLVYDKANSPTGNANAGGSGADPHTHPITHTSTAVGGSYLPRLGGPFQVGAHFVYGGGADRIVYLAVFPHMEGGLTYLDTRTYPFASRGVVGDYTPTRFYVDIRNDGDLPITLGAGTRMQVFQNEIHRHNEVT